MKQSTDLEKKFNEQMTLEFEASIVYRQLGARPTESTENDA